MHNLNVKGVFNPELMLEKLGGNINLAKMIIPSAQKDIDQLFVKLQDAILKNDMKEAKMATHTMKGLLAQIGGINAALQMREADDFLKNGHVLDYNKLNDLHIGYQQLIAAAIKWTESVN